MRLFVLLAAVASGYWTGTVTTPAGALPIGIAITGGAATLDAPSLGYTDKPLTFGVSDQAVHFELELRPHLRSQQQQVGPELAIDRRAAIAARHGDLRLHLGGVGRRQPDRLV